MIDELRQIAIFARAIDHGSFKGAAEELNLAPSVVSHHISQLEEKLGVTLIYRSTRKLTLTTEGERLLDSAKIMQQAIQPALNELRGQSSEPSGLLRVTVTSGLSQSKLVDGITEFCSRHPKIEIHLEFTDKKRHLISDRFDLAIQVGSNKDRALNRQTLFKGGRCIVGSKNYLSTCGSIKNPKDLNKCEWIVLAGVRGSISKLRKSGNRSVDIEPKGQISADSSLAVYRFVKGGAGIAIVPRFLTIDDVASGDVEYLLSDWRLDALDVFAEWPSNAAKDSIVRLFVAELYKTLNSAAYSDL